MVVCFFLALTYECSLKPKETQDRETNKKFFGVSFVC